MAYKINTFGNNGINHPNLPCPTEKLPDIIIEYSIATPTTPPKILMIIENIKFSWLKKKVA